MKIAFLGDITLDKEINVDSNIIQLLEKCDFVVANLEGVVLENKNIKPFKTYGSIIYNSEYYLKLLLEKVKVTHFSIYNNHTYDFGEKGVESTLKFLERSNSFKLLGPCTKLSKNKKTVNLINCGLPEFFGFYKDSIKYGKNALEILGKGQNLIKNESEIVLGHFGIEMINALSDFECFWFNKIAAFNPLLIVRHHPHCLQSPFKINQTPCFPSIGDFSFIFEKKNRSIGKIIVYDVIENNIVESIVIAENSLLKVDSSAKLTTFLESPILLTKSDKKELLERYLKEYREGFLYSFKKGLKQLFGKEDQRHSLAMASTHFIQPYLFGELLEESISSSK